MARRPSFNSNDSSGLHITTSRSSTLPERMSNMKIHEVGDLRHTTTPKRLLHWKLEKVGDDWQFAHKTAVSLPQERTEKLVKKGKGSVISEITNMGDLRRQQVYRLVEEANKESEDASWEIGYVKTNKERRKSGGNSVRSMDVILVNASTEITRKRVTSTLSSPSSKPMAKDWGMDTKKDTVLDNDPFDTIKLFHNNGKPIDVQGMVEHNIGDLPAEIPRDEPIGKRAERQKEGKRELPKARGESKVLDSNEPVPVEVGGDTLDAIISSIPRSRGERYSDPIKAASGRSGPRKRSSGDEPASNSQPRPTDFHSQSLASSSVSSEESRYGLDKEESSHTSRDTCYDPPQRDNPRKAKPRYRKRYETDHGKESRRQTRVYYKESASSLDRQAPRYSGCNHSPIPVSPQVEYSYRADIAARRYAELLPIRDHPVQLHYPNELVDIMAKERDAETYIRDTIRDEELNQRERDIASRMHYASATEHERQRTYHKSYYQEPYYGLYGRRDYHQDYFRPSNERPPTHPRRMYYQNYEPRASVSLENSTEWDSRSKVSTRRASYNSNSHGGSLKDSLGIPRPVVTQDRVWHEKDGRRSDLRSAHVVKDLDGAGIVRDNNVEDGLRGNLPSSSSPITDARRENYETQAAASGANSLSRKVTGAQLPLEHRKSNNVEGLVLGGFSRPTSELGSIKISSTIAENFRRPKHYRSESLSDQSGITRKRTWSTHCPGLALPHCVSPDSSISTGTSEGEQSFVAGQDPPYQIEAEGSESEFFQWQFIYQFAEILVQNCLFNSLLPSAGMRRRAGSQEGSSAPSSSQSASQLTAATSIVPSSKRSREGRGDPNDDEDTKRPANPKRPRPDSEGSEQLLACPYAKFDPARYSEQNVDEVAYRGCASCLLRDIGRLKQHLYRVHRRPDHYCGSCFEAFDTQDLLDAHTRRRPACEVGDPLFQEKMTKDQMNTIKRRDMKGHPRDIWFKIFKILFPGALLPRSPYANSGNPEAVRHFVQFFRWFGPETFWNLMRDRREQEGDLPPLTMSTQQIVDEAFEIALPEYLRRTQTSERPEGWGARRNNLGPSMRLSTSSLPPSISEAASDRPFQAQQPINLQPTRVVDLQRYNDEESLANSMPSSGMYLEQNAYLTYQHPPDMLYDSLEDGFDPSQVSNAFDAYANIETNLYPELVGQTSANGYGTGMGYSSRN